MTDDPALSESHPRKRHLVSQTKQLDKTSFVETGLESLLMHASNERDVLWFFCADLDHRRFHKQT